MIRVPDGILLDSEERGDLITAVWGELETRWNDRDYLQGRAILTALNQDVDALNDEISNTLPGEVPLRPPPPPPLSMVFGVACLDGQHCTP
jgi:hypothetical protein